jgi:hypothetical protein
MAEIIFHRNNDRFSSSDIIDLTFINSSLLDIRLTESELFETACLDYLALQKSGSSTDNKYRKISKGKLVF